jgi:GNAT superfamily N-acetyltransferase
MFASLEHSTCSKETNMLSVPSVSAVRRADDGGMRTTTPAELDELADAFFDTFDSLTTLPGTRLERAPHGTCLVVSGMLAPTSNGVCSPRRAAAVDEVAALAATMSGIGVPWSILSRGEPEQAVLDVAAGHGLTQRVELPMMLVDRADAVIRNAAEGREHHGNEDGREHLHEAVVHVVDIDRYEEYLRVFTQGFEMAPEALGPMAQPEFLEVPGCTCYLVRVSGRPVACGSALLSREHVLVGNVATLADHRGRGYGRLVTEAAVAGGFAAGARTAYLLASSDGRPLYESMGFRSVETWTYLFAGAKRA